MALQNMAQKVTMTMQVQTMTIGQFQSLSERKEFPADSDMSGVRDPISSDHQLINCFPLGVDGSLQSPCLSHGLVPEEEMVSCCYYHTC